MMQEKQSVTVVIMEKGHLIQLKFSSLMIMLPLTRTKVPF